MDSHHIQRNFFAGLLIVAAVLAFFVFRPYLGAVVLGATFAVVFYPVHGYILSLVRGRQSLAAWLTSTIVLLVVFVPLTFFGLQIFREAESLYDYAVDPDLTISNELTHLIEQRVKTLLPSFSLDINSYTQQVSRWLLGHVGQLFSSAAKVGVNLFLSLLTMYYLFRDGHRLLAWLISISPLKDVHDKRIIDRLQSAVNSVIRGSLVIALVQGIATGVGFWLFGVPNAALWGSVTILAALVPTLGTSLILIPAILYLFLINHFVAAFGLLVWGMLAVGLLDNLWGPKLMSRNIRLHPMIVLLAVIGGLNFFGPIGYIIGPLVASLLFTLLDIYPLIIGHIPASNRATS